MKKIASLLVAGALLLSTAGAAFATSFGTTQVNAGNVNIISAASAYTGSNQQFGGFNLLSTGVAVAGSTVSSVANVNVGSGFATQTNAGTTNIGSAATTSTGSNTQVGLGFHTGNAATTGNALSTSEVSSWANINFSGFSF